MRSSVLSLHPDRLLPADPGTRAIAGRLYAQIATLPIISPHGHTDPAWFATNAPFADATELLLVPDHYVFRMLYSQGIDLDAIGIPHADGTRPAVDPRAAWRVFAAHYTVLRGTPSALWLNHVFHDVFDLRLRLDAGTADHYYDHITAAL
ncbi:glucuronate isomerase, partial [Xanthomonas oryzae]